MSVQPPASGRPREISVVEPVSPALERVKQMLFKPFDLAKWITIGFCAWLAGLGESGGGSYGYGNHSGSNGVRPAEQFRHFYHQAGDFVMANLGWLIPLAVLAVLLVVALWLLVLWLSSRGKFMFLHCVALDKAEVAEPWSKYAAAANSLFRFRIGLGLVGMILTLPLLVFMMLAILRMVLQGEVDVAGVMTAAALGLVFVFVAVVLAIIRKFTVDFVVPIPVSARQRLSGGVAEFSGCWRMKAGAVRAVYPFSNRPDHGHWSHGSGGDPGDLLLCGLPDVAAVHRHGVVAAGARLQAVVFALLSCAAWLRRVSSIAARAAGGFNGHRIESDVQCPCFPLKQTHGGRAICAAMKFFHAAAGVEPATLRLAGAGSVDQWPQLHVGSGSGRAETAFPVSTRDHGEEIVLTNRTARLIFDVDSASAEISSVNVRLSLSGGEREGRALRCRAVGPGQNSSSIAVSGALSRAEKHQDHLPGCGPGGGDTGQPRQRHVLWAQ